MPQKWKVPIYKKNDKKEIPRFIGSNLKAESELFSPLWDLSYNFPYNPDPLCSGNNYSIYDEMVDDDQIKPVIAIKKDMVINTGWKISGENEEINKFVTDCFKHINENSVIDSSFDDVLRDMLSSYEYGFSLTEPVYALIDGKYKYISIKTRAPHSFKFDLDTKGNLKFILQTTNFGDIPFNPSTFIHHAYQMQFGNPYGKSDLRSAYKSWKAKKFFSKFFAIYGEKFATGTVVGKYPQGATTDEIEEFYKVLNSIQNATSMAISEDFIIDFIQMQRDAGTFYIKALDFFAMQMARTILVPDLLGIGGSETKGGSYSLGKEQFKMFLGTIKKDRASLSRKVTMRLVRPLVLSNFGDIECNFEFIPYSHGDIEKYLDLWIKAVTGNIFKANDDEINYFRNATGFPEGEIKEAEKPEPINPLNPNNSPIPNDPNKDKQGLPAESKKSYAKKELTSYEKKVNFAKIERTLNEEESKIIPFINKAATEIENSLIKQIEDKKVLIEFNTNKIKEIEAKNLKPMNVALRNYYTVLFKKSYETAKEELFPNGDKKKYEMVLLPTEFVDLLQMEAFKTVGDYSVDITKRAKNMVIHSIKSGAGAVETIKIIRDGLKKSTEVWINTVIRTKTTEIYNQARKQYWEKDPLAKQIVEAYQWSSILDQRTSPVCEYLHGKIFAIGELSNRVTPPAHFSCRSLLVPITKFEDYKTDPKGDFNEEKLKKLGGGMLSIGGNMSTKKKF